MDFLRDEALRLAATDLQLACKLMTLAYQARPDGHFIKKKHDEYKSRLEQK